MSNLEQFQIVEKLFNDTYLIVDPGIVKLLCATVIANRFNTDPVWLFIVAPSGGGKTEFIMSINKLVDITPLSTVTSKTFISGKRPKAGDETSLLFKIGQNGILTFKDFTTMLTLNSEERNSIMGQLREIYDGSMTRAYGTGEKIEWKGKVGLIAGVTTVIHVARELYASMGERFIMYAPTIPDRKEVADRAMTNTDDIKDRRDLIQEEMRKFLDEKIGIPTTRPALDPSIKKDIIILAELSTRARSPVDREWRSPQKDITYVHPPEMPTRFATQLGLLASAMQIINGGELTAIDKQTLFKVAFDSIADTRRIALRHLAIYNEVETSGLAVKIDYPTATVRRWLEDLNALKLVERVKSGGKADRWRLKIEYRHLIQRFENLKDEGAELTESNADGSTQEDPLNDALQARSEQEIAASEPSVEQQELLSGDDTSS